MIEFCRSEWLKSVQRLGCLATVSSSGALLRVAVVRIPGSAANIIHGVKLAVDDNLARERW